MCVFVCVCLTKLMLCSNEMAESLSWISCVAACRTYATIASIAALHCEAVAPAEVYIQNTSSMHAYCFSTVDPLCQ